MIRRITAAAYAAGLAALVPLTALAAVAPQDAPGESNLGFLLAGTALAWAGFFVYTFYLGRKNRELRRDVEDLQRTLADKGTALDPQKEHASEPSDK